MIKKQEQHADTLFPIKQSVLDADFKRLGGYNTDNLELLKSFWLDNSLQRNPSHELLTLTMRPEIKDHALMRRAYRAGVLVGTTVMRHTLDEASIAYDTVDLAAATVTSLKDHTATREQFPALLPENKLSRFALSQFFDSEVDIAQHLQETLESDWLSNHNTFQPQATADAPHNDWLAVGMGDTLALYGTLYARHMGADTPQYETKPLEEEPALAPSHL